MKKSSYQHVQNYLKKLKSQNRFCHPFWPLCNVQLTTHLWTKVLHTCVIFSFDTFWSQIYQLFEQLSVFEDFQKVYISPILKRKIGYKSFWGGKFLKLLLLTWILDRLKFVQYILWIYWYVANRILLPLVYITQPHTRLSQWYHFIPFPALWRTLYYTVEKYFYCLSFT